MTLIPKNAEVVELSKNWRLVAPVPEYDTWGLVELREDGTASGRCNYSTREEASADYSRWAANGNCKECGDVLYDQWIEDVKQRVLTEKLCHGCLFWSDYAKTSSDPAHLVVNGYHYVISPDQPNGYRGFVGHGGAEFLIKFSDGREVVSRNLWAQGQVPQHFRDRLPDNAEFLQRGHKRIGPFAGYGGSGSADAECQPANVKPKEIPY